MSKGKFITFEGADGSGKSTQAALLAEGLKEAHIDALLTREPGGAPGAEDIRKLLVEGDVARWDALSEALLHYAARREHLEKTVLPALGSGRWVISDRFADSTLAYQGYGHGLDRELIRRLHRLVVGAFSPDLTVVLDLAVEVGLERTAERAGGEDRYERMDGDFHRRLRQGFLAIAEGQLDRCALVDASGSIQEVQKEVRKVVQARLGVEFS